MFDRVTTSLSSALPKVLVDELLAAYQEAKRNYYLGGLRLSGVEGGRFCEAMFRILEWAVHTTFTPLGKALKTEKLIRDLENLPQGSHPDSIRIHIPRSLRVVYDIRNKRDLAHLADGIDPNLQDSTIVVTVLDWVLAELIRLYHPGLDADSATKIVDALVTRKIPVVQDFNGFPKVLRGGLQASEYVLVLLYDRGPSGASLEQLRSWVPPAMRANLRRTLERLVHQLAFAHFDGARYLITRSGEHETEDRRLLER